MSFWVSGCVGAVLCWHWGCFFVGTLNLAMCVAQVRGLQGCGTGWHSAPP